MTSKLLLATLATAAASTVTGAAAQSNVTLYGRVDLSFAQQADATSNKEVRNGSGSRFGLRGSEDLGDGLKAVFHLEHRFNADTGAQNNATRFWEGKSIVGLEGGFGRLTLGREENPAYTLSQNAADPWGGDTVAGNGSIVSGRIGSTRYSDAINYRYSGGGFTFGAQMTEGDGQDDRPYSLGLGYAAGALKLGLGFENPGDADDDWLTLSGSYNFGSFELRGLVGNGSNANGQKHAAWLLAGTMKLGSGELRLSYGQLKNKDLDVVADKQLGLGYHHAMSKRTTLYADLTSEKRDNLPGNRESTGWDIGIKHNF